MIPVIGQSGPVTAYLEGTTLGSAEAPSLTYRMDWENKRIIGQLDGLEAAQQAVVKVLRTERYDHLIYSFEYGTEWRLVLGQDRLLARAELRRMITEALLQDERITGIDHLEAAFSGDKLSVSCQVATTYGSFQLRKEMNARV